MALLAEETKHASMKEFMVVIELNKDYSLFPKTTGKAARFKI